jgi:hypothetical protein
MSQPADPPIVISGGIGPQESPLRIAGGAWPPGTPLPIAGGTWPDPLIIVTDGNAAL